MPHSAEHSLTALYSQRDQLDQAIERADENENPIERTTTLETLTEQRDAILEAITTVTQESHAPGSFQTT